MKQKDRFNLFFSILMVHFFIFNNYGVRCINSHCTKCLPHQKALEINQQNSSAWDDNVYDLTKLNKSDEALKAIDKAIEINPLDSMAWTNEALKAIDKAIEINPLDSMAWTNKGVILTKMGIPDEAIKAYDKVIEI